MCPIELQCWTCCSYAFLIYFWSLWKKVLWNWFVKSTPLPQICLFFCPSLQESITIERIYVLKLITRGERKLDWGWLQQPTQSKWTSENENFICRFLNSIFSLLHERNLLFSMKVFLATLSQLKKSKRCFHRKGIYLFLKEQKVIKFQSDIDFRFLKIWKSFLFSCQIIRVLLVFYCYDTISARLSLEKK